MYHCRARPAGLNRRVIFSRILNRGIECSSRTRLPSFDLFCRKMSVAFQTNNWQLENSCSQPRREHCHQDGFSVWKRERIVMAMRLIWFDCAESGDAEAGARCKHPMLSECHLVVEGQLGSGQKADRYPGARFLKQS